MKRCLVDVNVWIALAHDGHVHHRRAVKWFDSAVDGETCFCRITQLAFLRLLTTERIARSCGAKTPSSSQAWDCYDAFLGDRRVSYLAEPSRIEDEFRRLTETGFAAPKLWTDAYLAAFARTADIGLATFDGAFARREAAPVLVIIE